jgi:nucleoid-associated protein YgaU
VNPLFAASSRYDGLDTDTLVDDDGREIVFLRRRFVPHPASFSVLREHVVVEGDRLDNLSARYLGDPFLYWRICDANRAVRPRDLVAEYGRRLRITLPEGVQGGLDADG